MTNLTPVAQPGFPDVYLLATTDPVQGGPEGVDNLPHKQLAERTENLKARADGVDALVALIKTQIDGLNLNSGSAVRVAVLLNWLYGDASPSFELFVPGFSWRDVTPIAVTQAVAGDDTLDLAKTEGLVAGRTYVLYGADGLQIETIEVSSVLTATRLRARLNLTHTLNAQSGAFLARTAADVKEGYAVFQDGDAYYSRVITELRAQSAGQHVLRRSAEGAGAFTVSYRVAGSTAWALAPLVTTVAGANNTRDEFRTIGVGGAIELRVVYAGVNGSTERVEHMAILPPARVDAITAVSRPKNVTPADQAANVGQTPTLTGTAFLALYGLTQVGAEFQIARNPSMSDLVLNTSTDFLASWVGVSGQSAPFADLVATGAKAFTLIASGVSLKTADGGLTFATGTVTGDLRRVHADTTANLLCAVGAAGAIRTSADGGLTYTARTPAASYAGTFSGVFVRGAFVVAVGDGGTIQRSINGGAIFNAAVPDGAYAGTFNDLAGDGAGKLIAVGSGGAIQSSPDDGQTWVQRNAPAGYTGTYRAVAMDATGRALAVGDNGALHLSTDFGATWTAKAAAGGYAGSFTGVALAGSLVVAVGTGAEIQTSKDGGATFTHRVAGSGASAAFRAVALDANGYGLGVGDAGLVQRTLKLDSATTTFTVPAGTDFLQTGGVYWWRVRYQASSGDYSPWSAPTAFATGTVFNYVAAPRNLAPASGDTNVSLLPTLQTSAFAYVGAADTHAKSQYQIATSAAFTALAYDSGETGDLLSHQVAAGGLLTAQGTYYWRARHKGAANGFGAWSEPTAFTAQARPNRPVLTTPADGATQVSTSPTLTTSAFSEPGGGSHTASQYQVSARASFDSLVYDSGDTTSLTSLTLPAGTLSFDTPYFARARHKDAAGAYSAWSNVVGFRTSTAVSIAKAFASSVYAGTSGTITHVNGLNFSGQGGRIQIAKRGATDGKSMARYNTARGPGQRHTMGGSPLTGYAQGVAGVTQFNANGVTIGNDPLTNEAGQSYICHSFARTPRFYDLLKWVGDGSGPRAIPHILALPPGSIEIMIPDVQTTTNLYHRGATSPNAAWWRNKFILESGEAATDYGSNAGLAAAPDGANIYVGADYNVAGTLYVAEVLAHDPAPDGVILCDVFVHGPSAQATFDTGWSGGAQFVRTKTIGVGTEVADTVRTSAFAGNDGVLRENGPAEMNYMYVEQVGSLLKFGDGFTALNNSTNLITVIRAAGA